jgi:hypothetical protein
LLINKITNNRDDWVLRDYFRDCEEDIKLDVVADSIEVKQRGLFVATSPELLTWGLVAANDWNV